MMTPNNPPDINKINEAANRIQSYILRTPVLTSMGINKIFGAQLFFKCEKRHLRKKIELLQCYKSQLVKNRSYFSEEFINGLARTRGVQVNSEYAEAFEVIKWIV